jgi:hypothetical protein
MKIDAQQAYHGIPLLSLRKFLRSVRDTLSWDVTWLSRDLGLPAPEAQALAEQLATDGYISAGPFQNGEWSNTIKGNALAGASAAPLVNRSTAEARLQEFLDRVEQVNLPTAPFALWVDRVVLLGSMLGTKERVSDVDLSIKLIHKPGYDWRSQDRVSIALSSGRRFGSFFEQLIWPTQEVLLYLRNRRRSLSFVEWNEEWINTQPHRVIYRRSQPARQRPRREAEWF